MYISTLHFQLVAFSIRKQVGERYFFTLLAEYILTVKFYVHVRGGW